MIIVVGAAGEEKYGERFDEWSKRLLNMASDPSIEAVRIGPVLSTSDASVALAKVNADSVEDAKSVSHRDQLAIAIKDLPADDSIVWLFFIGHGTFSTDVSGNGLAKFNLVGPDISASELGDWLAPLDRSMVIANATASSGPFVRVLSGPKRVLLTATMSGEEENFAVFGDHLTSALGDLDSDLDHDGAVSILEAFLAASKQVEQQYESKAQLATEHPMIDDNGDGVGTTDDLFVGTRVEKKANADTAVDGRLAAMRFLREDPSRRKLTPEERQRIETLLFQHEELRDQRGSMSETEYLDAIEPVLTEIAKIDAGQWQPSVDVNGEAKDKVDNKD
ncbi:MAG: hypothetical protein AAF664_26500 [Planctomycetota bacterium]